MKPREYLPAGTPEHREDFQALTRRCAVDLAQVVGSGDAKFPGGRRYRLLPVGDARCIVATSAFLEGVERLSLELFDRAVEARDLPAGHNIRTIRRKSA